MRAIARTGGVYPRARWRAHDFIADYLCKNELRMSSGAVCTIVYRRSYCIDEDLRAVWVAGRAYHYQVLTNILHFMRHGNDNDIDTLTTDTLSLRHLRLSRLRVTIGKHLT